MSFTQSSYLLFLPLVMLIYYLVPKRGQNAVLAAASLLFYVFNLPSGPIFGKSFLPLVLLLASVAFTYFLARVMAKRDKAARRIFVFAGIAGLVAVLCLFKYQGLFLPVFFAPESLVKLALPLGISYYTFASISYLADVYSGQIEAERSYLSLFGYLAFFGTIICGPICRAGKILPQLQKPRVFDTVSAGKALRTALIGFFKLVAVANVLGLCVNYVYANLAEYSGSMLIIVAVLYAFELYYEFSGFSDIAVATGALLGIELPQNFNTPYFANNFSAFWNRWHISLSSWLQDYIFMPLVWGRWTSHIPVLGKRLSSAPPVMSSLVLTFVFSGLWHGNTLPFFVWGVMQAVFRIGEELMHKYIGKPQKKPSLALRIFKTGVVFVLWSFSLIIFRCGTQSGGLSDALYFISHMFAPSALAGQISTAVMGGFYPDAAMVPVYIAFVVLVLGIAIFMDCYVCFRQKGQHFSMALSRLPILPRWICYYALMGLILLGFIMQSGGFGGNVSLAYAGF